MLLPCCSHCAGRMISYDEHLAELNKREQQHQAEVASLISRHNADLARLHKVNHDLKLKMADSQQHQQQEEACLVLKEQQLKQQQDTLQRDTAQKLRMQRAVWTDKYQTMAKEQEATEQKLSQQLN